MFPDGAADHFTLNGGVHPRRPRFLPTAGIVSPAGNAEFDEFVTFFHPDLADAAIMVEGAFRYLSKIVAILDSFLPAPNCSSYVDVELDPGTDVAAFVAR